jgi:hypothetical protein
MQHIFGDHIGRTVEAYVNGIVVKTRKADDLVGDLSIAFACKIEPREVCLACRGACF